MRISDIYDALCRLYHPEFVVNISKFLICAVDAPKDTVIGARMHKKEALIIRETGDSLELGLFIAPEVLAVLNSGCPMNHLEELAYAIEGVSHFLCVTDRAASGRKVSMLELEIQAEVDKFIVTHLVEDSQRSRLPSGFFDTLFRSCVFNAALSREERERYETASHFAAKFCSHLRESCFYPLRASKLEAMGRDFFKRGLTEKIRPLIP